ncbi:unnamed protein product [Acanthoscelides obtectus]|uniref:non-specific serine/threonine protein kinase n=1 Tax=Acanthoscelides obtectus TaxID=200917 RepID=A0A9P0PI07_ACAOB|nr:unnamed protein product [Acanthoscelides obtectus]CAK1622189.1 Interleukin-1 receptor-associated kinase 4 [Acanthoscelides obtectus]
MGPSSDYYSPSLEIRKLPPRHVKELTLMLETHELWKRVMSIIPKKLEKENFKCDITPHNPRKYTSEHFRLIERETDQTHRPSTEILFEEWGTSGRVRPSLGHLLYLLTKLKLFRAADYVAETLLNQEKPPRPEIGPGAPVPIPKPVEQHKNPTDEREIEKILDEIDYPAQAVNRIRSNSQGSNKSKSPPPAAIPEIVITPNEEFVPTFPTRFVTQREKPVSDMIKFSTDTVESESSIYEDSDSTISNNPGIVSDSNNVTQSTSDNETSDSYSYNQETGDVCVSENIPRLSQILPSEKIKPKARVSFADTTDNNKDSDSSEDDSLPNIPNLEAIIGLEKTHIKEPPSDKPISPLPSLSLNTALPHLSYSELEVATNNFDESSIEESGRLLGKGSFGTVFLAHGLLNKPLAVKKLTLELNNSEVDNEIDTITKQFTNEIESLSKYKHENLLELLGYSCDGNTYCLLYEYITGGTLRYRLKGEGETLMWKDRIQIANATAKAVVYLHTAYSTPLIHRDIKSLNILLDENNKPKLCDFGLIKTTPSQDTIKATTIFGTSAYMAPEAFKGNISVKLDTFSYGVVLLELLTSLPPNDDEREDNDLVTHVYGIEDKMSLVDKNAGSWKENEINYAEKFYDIAERCVEERKNDRPTMVEVEKLLQTNLINYLWIDLPE